MVSSNRCVDWDSQPKRLRRSAAARLDRSAPPRVIRPACGDATRNSSAAKVDLPQPDGPRTATRAPCATSSVSPSNRSGRSGAQRNRTPSNRNAVAAGSGAGEAGSAPAVPGRADSSTRCAAAAAWPVRAPARDKPPAASNAATRRNTAPTAKTGRVAAPHSSSRTAALAAQESGGLRQRRAVAQPAPRHAGRPVAIADAVGHAAVPPRTCGPRATRSARPARRPATPRRRRQPRCPAGRWRGRPGKGSRTPRPRTAGLRPGPTATAPRPSPPARRRAPPAGPRPRRAAPGCAGKARPAPPHPPPGAR